MKLTSGNIAILPRELDVILKAKIQLFVHSKLPQVY